MSVNAKVYRQPPQVSFAPGLFLVGLSDTFINVSGQCPHDFKLEDGNVATQLIEMNLPRRLATR